MKILHVIPTYLPAYRYGGPIKSVHCLNKWLAKKGVEVTVYTTNIDGPKNLDAPLSESVDVDGVKVFYFKNSFPRSWFYSRDLHRALARNIKNFDLIHITSVFLAASALGYYYAKKFKKPYVISPRGSLMKEPLKKKSSLKKKVYIALIEKRNLREADAIHFTAEAEKEEYLKFNLPLKKAVIIPNGLDPEEFQSYEVQLRKIDFRKKFGIAADKKIVLFLSRLSWKKGLDTLVPAFAEVAKKEPKALLVLAGPDDEKYKKTIENLIERHNLKEKVVFTGLIVGADRIAALQDSDVFVLPSYSESFGMAVVEAMACGLPIVITKGVGISPSISKANAGIVIEKDKIQLTNAILKVLSNLELSKEIGRKGKQLLETEFSLPKITDRFIKEYNELI